MKLDRRNIQKILFIGSVLILLYLGLQHMNIVFEFLTWMLYVMMPFIAAVCFTFFLNVPLKAIERHLFQPKKGKTVKPIFEKMRRPVALVLSMLLFIAIITVFLLIIIPKLGESLNTIIKSVPGAIDSLVAFVNDLSESNEYVKNIISNLEIDWDDLKKYITNFLQNDAASIVSSTMSMITSVFSAALNVLLGLILAIYTLMKKEQITSGLKRLIYSVFPLKTADFVVEVGSLANKSVRNFITVLSQILEDAVDLLSLSERCSP